MKIIVSNPTLGAIFILLGCTFLVDTTVASNPRILRGQLHKSNTKPSRRRHVQVKAEAPLKETTLKDAPVKASIDDHREAPVPKEEKKKTTIKATPDSSMLKSPPTEPKQLHKATPDSSMNLGHLLVKPPTWAPTMAPIVDEDLFDSDGGNTTEVEEDAPEEDLELQELFFETNSLNEVSSSTVISGCITVNVIAFLFLYQNAW